MDFNQQDLAELEAEREALKKRDAEIEVKIQAIKSRERKVVLSDIREKVREWGFTEADVFQSQTTKASAKRKSKITSVTKYRNEKGDEWGGGRGRKPKWIIDALAAGEDIEKFRV